METLLELVVPDAPVGRVVDLYCGVGLFSVPLARQAGDVIGVETSPVAVRDAIANAKAAGAIRARFVRADAVHFAEGFNFHEDDYIIVDPPRGGLPAALRLALVASPVRRICYVSCDPAAFGRDASALGAGKFHLDRIDLLDLFPNTHHFETVGVFTRAPENAALDSSPREGRY